MGDVEQYVEILFQELKEKISGINGLEDVDPRDFYNRVIGVFTYSTRHESL